MIEVSRGAPARSAPLTRTPGLTAVRRKRGTGCPAPIGAVPEPPERILHHDKARAMMLVTSRGHGAGRTLAWSLTHPRSSTRVERTNALPQLHAIQPRLDQEVGSGFDGQRCLGARAHRRNPPTRSARVGVRWYRTAVGCAALTSTARSPSPCSAALCCACSPAQDSRAVLADGAEVPFRLLGGAGVPGWCWFESGDGTISASHRPDQSGSCRPRRLCRSRT